MSKIDITKMDEAQFEVYYRSLNDPADKIKELKRWRIFQTKIVSKFIAQVRLMASQQYTTMDHFLLELLQNADDNTYSNKVTPTVKVTLNRDYFRLDNNEVGFNEDDLFAITYAAYSTKLREKTAGTYIGEKGIGFKSVFSVADYVDIHSGPYHFRLKDNEFIIPHSIAPLKNSGTTIIIHLKKQDDIIPVLSQHLQQLCSGAAEFTLFLQNIEKLIIKDNISRKKGEVTTVRDIEKGIYLVESDGKSSEFYIYRYLEKIPTETVNSRFSELHHELEREILFAVPFPADSISEGINQNGRLFCFLPTEVRTGTPINIQVDAQTTTNRENIRDMTSSAWNKAIFNQFVPQMVNMYVALTQHQEFNKHLPLYFPYNIEETQIGNDWLRDLLVEVYNHLKEESVILDRHGRYQKPESVRIVPEPIGKLFYDDQCEKAYTKYMDDGYEYTFVELDWVEKYGEQLKSLGVEDLDEDAIMEILKIGVPDSVDITDDKAVRMFLEKIFEFTEEYLNPYGAPNYLSLKNCPIFPIKKGEKREWGTITSQVLFTQNIAPGRKISEKFKFIDPIFTYSPGGAEQKKIGGRIRDFNKKFRAFLTEKLELQPDSPAEALYKTTIGPLKRIEDDPNDTSIRKEINQKWFQVYQTMWNRQKTTRREIGEDRWDQIIKEIGDCKIPVRSAGEDIWRLEKINVSFLGPQFKTEYNLNQIYKGTEAPIIKLDYIKQITKDQRAKRLQKYDEQDWCNFLLECGGKTGPHLILKDLSKMRDSLFAPKDFAKPNGSNFKKNVIEAINNHYEFNGKDYVQLKRGSLTFSLDEYSLKILGKEGSRDIIAKYLSAQWERLLDKKTNIYFTWGNMRNSRVVKVDRHLVQEQVSSGIFLKSNKGMAESNGCFDDNPFNRKILGELCAFVNVKKNEYNDELLCNAGFSSQVNAESIIGLINKWYKTTPPEKRSSRQFNIFLQPIINLCNFDKEAIQGFRAKLKLFSAKKNRLLLYKNWKQVIWSGEYPSSLLEKLSNIYRYGVSASPEEAVSNLFDTNVGRSPLSFIESMVSLGKQCISHDPSKIKQIFNNKLRSVGIKVFGKTVKSHTSLPILWDIAPPPVKPKKVIYVPSHFCSNEYFIQAVNLTEWPLLSVTEKSVVHDKTLAKMPTHLSDRLFVSMSRIISEALVHRPEIKALVEELEIFNDRESVVEMILTTNALVIEFLDRENKKNRYEVPCWYARGKLIIKNALPIQRVIPNYIDLKCGTTFSGIFKYIWEGIEVPETDIPEIAGSGDPDSDSDNIGPTEDLKIDIFGENAAEEDDSPGDKEQGTKQNTKRKRLYSYVVRRGQTSPGKKAKANAARNKKIEEAGKIRLLEYLNLLNVDCKSVEKEDKGYDFEVKVGKEILYIELKASEDVWKNWEHSLSPNEFRTAMKLKDKYYLCVIDQVLEVDKSKIYFIQDPANKADGFLFDWPWKILGRDMQAVVNRLKADQGILED